MIALIALSLDFVVFAVFGASMRQWYMSIYLRRMLAEVHEAVSADIDRGLQWEWRYNAMHVSGWRYFQMVALFWRPLDSFFPQREWIVKKWPIP